MTRLLTTLLLTSFALCACDRLGLPDPAKQAAMREEEGKAIGAACRQSGRALEDCFSLNRSALKAAIFAGWREMNDYMAQNKIEIAQPEAEASTPVAEAEPKAARRNTPPRAKIAKPPKLVTK